MKKVLFPFLFLLIASFSFSQDQIDAQLKASKNMFTSAQVDIFTPLITAQSSRLAEVKDQKFLQIAPNAVRELNQSAADLMTVSIPLSGKNYDLELYKYDFTTPDFAVKEIQNGIVVNQPKVNIGLHYRGKIKGDDNSMVAMSVLENSILINVSSLEESYIVHPENEALGRYVYYPSQSLEVPVPEKVCSELHAPDETHSISSQASQAAQTSCTAGVDISFVVDYDMYQQFGSNTAAATNYVTGLFNQVSILFAADGINVGLEEVFVNTAEDGYPHTSSIDDLDHFRANLPNFNGRLAHLLSTAENLGGVAYLNVICSSQRQFRTGYSAIFGSFNNYPTYSWDVNVVAHELGHNLGSPHTQSCFWNGETIDDCANKFAFDRGETPEGDACWNPNSPKLPSGGGTIMSYCHLIPSVGINLSKGFGDQPAELLRFRIASATCISAGNDEVVNTLESTPAFTTITANASCQNGVWIDYFYDNNTVDINDDILVLSINADGRDIGELGDPGFAVKLHSTTNANASGGLLLNSAPHKTNPNDFYVMKRYWEIETMRQPGGNVEVRFPYTKTDIDNLLSSVPSASRNDVVAFALSADKDLNPENGHAGVNFNDIVEFQKSASPTNNSWIEESREETLFARTTLRNLYSGGLGILSNKGNISPFVLNSFTAGVNSEATGINLNWTTAEEFNSSRIFLEKSFNGSPFETINQQDAEGFSTSIRGYDYVDPQVFVGTNTYRLRLVGNKGTEIFSDEVSVLLEDFDGDIVLYPNPVINDNLLRVDIRKLFPLTNSVNVDIYNSVGQHMFGFEQGQQIFNVDVSTLSTGTYFLIINSDNSSKTLKFVVSR